MKILLKGLKELVFLSPSKKGYVRAPEALVSTHETSEGRDSSDSDSVNSEIALVCSEKSNKDDFNKILVTGQVDYNGGASVNRAIESPEPLPGPSGLLQSDPNSYIML